MSTRDERLLDKKKMIDDMRRYFNTGEKMHFLGKTWLDWEDVMWVLDAALKENLEVPPKP